MGLASRIIGHLFTTARNRDGQAAGLEQVAVLANMVPAVQPGGSAAIILPTALPGPTGAGHARPGRTDAVDEALAQKVLLGWVQNRNQTLHPLTLNLRNLDAAGVDLLLRTVAAGLAAGGGANDARLRRARSAIEHAHGDAAMADRLSGLAASDQPLPPLFDALHGADLSGHAYAITMAALDQRDRTNRAFTDYMATRLSIPETVSRSIARRYRS